MPSNRSLRVSVDPGLSGGFAVSFPDGSYLGHNMPDTPTGIVSLLQHYWDLANVHFGCPSLVLLEKLTNFHRRGNNAVSSAKLARNYGQLEGVLAAMHFDVLAVEPKIWQRPFAPLPKDYSRRKAELKNLMQLRHPGTSITNATADAFGLLAWHDTNTQAEE